jgi:glycosyltransferase involved in cell wall biosynthesis
MEFPLISAKCITYGRVDMLEEALHSFLQQDYPGPKEMIIVNDYPLQTLIFDHPEVKIYNTSHTFTNIGAKENFAMELCNGEIICQWDDDDIALPNHLTNVAKVIGDNNIIHWLTGVFYNEPNITEVGWIGNSGIAFTKKVWEAVGGHPLENAGYDMTFVQSIHALDHSKKLFAKLPPEEASWFYMWHGRGYHMSGHGTDVAGKANVIQRHSVYVENLRAKGKIPTGEIVLKPHWNKDYKQMLKDFLAHQ